MAFSSRVRPALPRLRTTAATTTTISKRLGRLSSTRSLQFFAPLTFLLLPPSHYGSTRLGQQLVSMSTNSASNQLEQQKFWNDNFWGKGVKKGDFFDLGHASPPLVRIRSSLPAGTGFVPGCGRGYDCIALSEDGKRKVTGLDIVERAVDAAKSYRDEQKIDAKNVDYICADFFKFKPDSKFDVVFDYTFLCALPPELRENWAKQMATLVKERTGRLVTLIFPIVDKQGGPPYAMSVKLVADLVKGAGFELVSIEEDVKDSVESRKGMEALAVWKLPTESRM